MTRMVLFFGLFATAFVVSAKAEDPHIDAEGIKPATTIDEARARARILHEAFHGALQVMHRDFFDEDDARVLPSGSLEDVFKEMKRSYDIQVGWLAVNAKAMNIDHEPKDDVEKTAVKALASGKREYELATEKEYLYVGKIRLASQCLKCHLPRRTSTEDRAAALSIKMPLNVISDPPGNDK